MVFAPEVGTASKPYKLWWKEDNSGGANAFTIGYSEGPSATGPFTLIEQGDWAGWFAGKAGWGRDGIEAPAPRPS